LIHRPLTRHEFTLQGTGGAVLLVHGLGGGPYELQLLGEHLHHELGWTVRAIRLPGHLAPATWMPHSTWPQWVVGVEEALAQLEHDTEGAAVNVVAFSAGCLPSLRLAEQGRLRGKLVLLAPFFAVYRPAGLSVEWGMKLTPYVPRRGPPLRDKAMRARVQSCVPFNMFSMRSAQSALDLAEQVLADAGKVEVPTLVLQGDRDTVVDPAGAERLAARIGGPRQFHVVKGSDHLLALDEQREEVFEAVTKFLR
jgi:carboxylesterase